MTEANKRGTPKLKPAVSWETDGGLFYKLSFHRGPYCQTGGDSYSPLPLSPCTQGLISDSLYILCRRSCHRSPSPAQVERAGMFYKHIVTILGLFSTSSEL